MAPRTPTHTHSHTILPLYQRQGREVKWHGKKINKDRDVGRDEREEGREGRKCTDFSAAGLYFILKVRAFFFLRVKEKEIYVASELVLRRRRGE